VSFAETKQDAKKKEYGQNNPKDSLKELVSVSGQARTEQDARKIEGDIEAWLLQNCAQMNARNPCFEAGKRKDCQGQSQSDDPQ